ncbi:MAG: hypothetical protein ACAH82_16075 [Solirubrobacteraceae bacterium]
MSVSQQLRFEQPEAFGDLTDVGVGDLLGFGRSGLPGEVFRGEQLHRHEQHAAAGQHQHAGVFELATPTPSGRRQGDEFDPLPGIEHSRQLGFQRHPVAHGDDLAGDRVAWQASVATTASRSRRSARMDARAVV